MMIAHDVPLEYVPSLTLVNTRGFRGGAAGSAGGSFLCGASDGREEVMVDPARISIYSGVGKFIGPSSAHDFALLSDTSSTFYTYFGHLQYLPLHRTQNHDHDMNQGGAIIYKGGSKGIPRDVTSVKIHPSVRSIKSRAFKDRSRLTIVIGGEGLEEVGDAAFQCCTSLYEISIARPVKSIGYRAFYECALLTTVDLCRMGRLETIGEAAFGLCGSIRQIDIPNAVRTLGNYAFYYCSQLTTVDLGKEGRLEEIGEFAFGLCGSLRRIDIPTAVRAIRTHAFYFCTRLTTVILGDGLAEIGSEAFYQCKSLNEIRIPPGVRAIREKTFFFCTRLTNVDLGDGLEEIGKEAFYECTSLERIDIPPGVRMIEEKAFYECSGLTTVNLGVGLEVIGEKAFGRCTSLRHIRIPSTVKAIDDDAFDGCSILTSVEFCDEIERFVPCDAMQSWWNGGVHERSLSTYCFLVRCGIPERLGRVHVMSWQADVHDMLRRIPTIYAEGLNAHFDSIDSKITFYESWGEVPILLGQIVSKDDIILKILSFF
jgi:hypothetical protein